MYVTLWRDPGDAGLRMERGIWRDPREAHEARPLLFSRVSREMEATLLAAAGDMAPVAPGEFAVVELPPGCLD